jgi:hypothetical protein
VPARIRRAAPLVFEDGYLRLPELSTYSGIGERTLEKYLHDPINPLPYYKVGGIVTVRRSEFDVWAKAFRVNNAPKDIEAMVDAMVRR